MEKYLNTKLQDLKTGFQGIKEGYNNKSPNERGQKYEKIFRRFLNDIFPYYDSFKGTVFNKSCDFVLAYKLYHPRFGSDDEQYYDVITSLVDTVIELKGTVQKSEIESGLDQCKKIKTYYKKYPMSDITGALELDNTYLGSWVHNFLIHHILVFREGNYKVFLNHIDNEFKKIISLKEKIEEFFKLPDIIFVIESNVLLLKDWKNFCYHICEQGIWLLAKKIEEYLRIYQLKNTLVILRNKLNKNFVNKEHAAFIVDWSLWNEKDQWLKQIVPQLDSFEKVVKYLNLKTYDN